MSRVQGCIEATATLHPGYDLCKSWWRSSTSLSLPQNNSLPTTKVGTPNTPMRRAVWSIAESSSAVAGLSSSVWNCDSDIEHL